MSSKLTLVEVPKYGADTDDGGGEGRLSRRYVTELCQPLPFRVSNDRLRSTSIAETTARPPTEPEVTLRRRTSFLSF